MEFFVHYDPKTGLAICMNTDAGSTIILVAVVISAINLILYIVFVFMFNRGLWLLNKQLLKVFVSEQVEQEMYVKTLKDRNSENNQPSKDKESTEREQTQPEISVVDSVSNTGSKTATATNTQTHTMTMTTAEHLQVAVKKYKSDGTDVSQKVRGIIRIYNLMKKQTILACIAIVSSTMIGVSTALNGELIFEFGWDAGLNLICIWMMITMSKRYWHCCKDYGLCKCCYLKTGRRFLES